MSTAPRRGARTLICGIRRDLDSDLALERDFSSAAFSRAGSVGVAGVGGADGSVTACLSTRDSSIVMASTVASAADLVMADLAAALPAARRGRMIQAIEWVFPIRTGQWQAASIPIVSMAADDLIAPADLAPAHALVSADSPATGRLPTVMPARTGRLHRIMARDPHLWGTGLPPPVMADITPRRVTAVRLRITARLRPRTPGVARIIPRRDPILRLARIS